MELKLGKYSSSAKPPEAFWISDEYNMMITMDINGNIAGRGDSHEANFEVYLIYDQKRHVIASANLWFKRNGKIIGQRHPDLPFEDYPMSRDHLTTSLLSLSLYSERLELHPFHPMMDIIKETGLIISPMARKTLSLNLWTKAIIGNKKAEWFFYLLEILTILFIYLPVYKLGMFIANYGEEVDQEDYVKHPILQELPKYKQVINKIIYPSYSMLISGYQLYVLDNFPLMRRILKKLRLQMIGKTNYVQQMLFGKKGIPREKIENFKAMQGGRWSGYLNSRNDRDMKILDPQPIFNNIDVDLARFLYNKTQL